MLEAPTHPRHLLVVVAMHEEEAAVLEALHGRPSTVSRIDHFGFEARTFSGETTISLLRCGIGAVNAALGVAFFVDRATSLPPIDGIVLLGVGGAVRTDLAIGDLVVSKQILQHDYFFSLDFGNPRVRPGGLVFTKKDLESHSPYFLAAPDLLPLSRLKAEGSSFKLGTILSGNEFVGTSARKQAIAELDPESLLVEMEAAGIAQVAEKLGIPFVVAKTVADRLFPDGTIESDFRACLEGAAKNAAQIARALVSG